MGVVRVLLVDKCREFLDAAAHFLAEDSDLVVIGCILSAREAVSRIPELCPDVVLLELTMPDMSGLIASLRITPA